MSWPDQQRGDCSHIRYGSGKKQLGSNEVDEHRCNAGPIPLKKNCSWKEDADGIVVNKERDYSLPGFFIEVVWPNW